MKDSLYLFSDIELCLMQYDLSKYPEDKKYREMVLKELGRRQKNKVTNLTGEKI